MATKRKKKALKKAPKKTAKTAKTPAKNSSIISTVIISLVIIAAATAAGVAVSKIRNNSLAANGVNSTVSPATIKITDTVTGKTRTMEVLPASAGGVQTANPVTTTGNEIAPVDHAQAAINAAARVSEAAKTGDFTYLFNVSTTKETIPHIDIAEAKFLFDSGKALFVDARGPSEFDEAHIKGAVNVPVAATPEELEKLKSKLKGKTLVTYCHGVGCHLADKSAYKLWDAGYTKIAIFFGGWPKWNEHKYPIVSKSK